MATANVGITSCATLKSPVNKVRDTMSLHVTAHTSSIGKPIVRAMQPATKKNQNLVKR